MPARRKTTKSKPAVHILIRHNVVHHLKNGFIPHDGNDFAPHALRHRALLVYSAFMIAIKAALIIVSIAFPSVSLYSFAITEDTIVKLTNEARSSAGIASVAPNAALRGAAQAKADDMIVRQYFAHEGPEGESPWSWVNQSGYRYVAAGENLAIHYTTAEALNQGWLASATHRANILDARFKDIGIGVAQGKIDGYDTIVVVQMFGAPRTTRLAVAGKLPEPHVLNASITLKDDRLQVAVKAPQAASVSGHMGETDIAFTHNQSSGTWIGMVDPRRADNSTQEIYATVYSNENNPETQLVATLVSKDNVGDVYRMEAKQETKLFGFMLDGLGDRTRAFYIATLVILSSILLVNIFVKFHVQRPTIVAHTLVVMGLAFLFTIV